MTKDDFDLTNFLQFHVKKGIEYPGKASFRSNTMQHMIESGKPLLLTVEGESGIMVLFPETVKGILTDQSLKIYGNNNDYAILRVMWNPQNSATLSMINALYKAKESINQSLKLLM